MKALEAIAFGFAYTIGVGLGILFWLGAFGIAGVLLWRTAKWLAVRR